MIEKEITCFTYVFLYMSSFRQPIFKQMIKCKRQFLNKSISFLQTENRKAIAFIKLNVDRAHRSFINE